MSLLAHKHSVVVSNRTVKGLCRKLRLLRWKKHEVHDKKTTAYI